jgi:hypothetical protein
MLGRFGHQHHAAAGREPLELHAGGHRDREQVADVGAFRLARFPVADRAAVDADLLRKRCLRNGAVPPRRPDALRKVQGVLPLILRKTCTAHGDPAVRGAP